MELPSDLVDFMASGVSLLVGTRDAHLVPACVRAMGAVIGPDLVVPRVTVFIPVATGQRTFANLRDNGRVAVTFSRVTDHRTVQIKGICTATRSATEDDRRVQERYTTAFWASLAEIGMPVATSSRLAWWPSVAVDIRAEALFDQTPGPTAGRRVDGGGR